jgi:hypothetical protein
VRGVRRAAARSIGGLAVACVVSAVGVPAAHAGATYTELPGGADLGVIPLALAYAADPGANRLNVSVGTGGAVFDDPVATLGPPEPGGRCSAVLPLTCTLTDVQTLDVNLGPDDDKISVGPGLPPTTVDGGEGADRADYSVSPAPATITLDGTAAGVKLTSVEGATGSAQADTITGSDQANNLVGLGGVDDIDGLAGVDDVDGGDGADHISGGDGNDILAGGAGRDALLGDAGDDQLAGGAEGDVLKGGPGQDTFSGGAGSDDILAADQVAETIDCGDDIGGGDIDTVAADLGPEGDLIGFDCERVTGLVVPETDPSPGTSGQPSSETQSQQSTASSDALAAAPAPVLPDAAPTPGDLTPPSARMRIAVRQRLVNVLARGISVPVSCSESCGISVAVLLDRTTAKKLDLAGRAGPAVLATATARLAKPGSRLLRARLTQRARRALRTRRSVRVTVQTLISDASGNGTLLQRRVTLRR